MPFLIRHAEGVLNEASAYSVPEEPRHRGRGSPGVDKQDLRAEERQVECVSHGSSAVVVRMQAIAGVKRGGEPGMITWGGDCGGEIGDRPVALGSDRVVDGTANLLVAGAGFRGCAVLAPRREPGRRARSSGFWTKSASGRRFSSRPPRSAGQIPGIPGTSRVVSGARYRIGHHDTPDNRLYGSFRSSPRT
jgi:hypothetical protein